MYCKKFTSQNFELFKFCFILNNNGKLIAHNDSFSKQYGYEIHDFERPFLDVFFKCEAFEQKEAFEKALLGKKQTFDAMDFVRTERPLILM